MKESKGKLEHVDYEQLTSSIPYLLAGLEGNTDGNKLKSFAVQQIGPSDFRVVVRAIGTDDVGDPVHLVCFTNSGEPGTALLYAEDGYREGTAGWSIDRFAKSIGDDGPSANGRNKLTISN